MGKKQILFFLLCSFASSFSEAIDYPALNTVRGMGPRCSQILSLGVRARARVGKDPVTGEADAVMLIQSIKASKRPASEGVRMELTYWLNTLILEGVNFFSRFRNIVETEIPNQAAFYFEQQTMVAVLNQALFQTDIGSLSLKDLKFMLKTNEEFNREVLDHQMVDMMDTHLHYLLPKALNGEKKGKGLDVDLISDVVIGIYKLGYEPSDYVQGLWVELIQRPEFEHAEYRMNKLTGESIMNPDSVGQVQRTVH